MKQENYLMTLEQIGDYRQWLHSQERSAATIEKYHRALHRFYFWLGQEKEVTKEQVISYKESLQTDHAPASVNAELAALNGFLKFQGWYDCVVTPLRLQRRIFQSAKRELSREEYERLVDTARRQGKAKLALLLQLMASTGLRVSEICYITAEAVDQGRAEISLKGKIRTILLPDKLCRKLKKFQKAEKIASGPLFRARSGKELNRKVIWAMMKRLCTQARVSPEKVFPHNLRHLFARSFYKVQKDVAKLADVLGHSSIETTRIYLLTSGTEHRQLLNRLHLVC